MKTSLLLLISFALMPWAFAQRAEGGTDPVRPSQAHRVVVADVPHLPGNEVISADIYPNPASVEAFVTYRLLPQTKDAKVLIYNVLGTLVKEISLVPSDSRIRIDVSQFNSGIYFYTLYADGAKQSTRRLVVKN